MSTPSTLSQEERAQLNRRIAEALGLQRTCGPELHDHDWPKSFETQNAGGFTVHWRMCNRCFAMNLAESPNSFQDHDSTDTRDYCGDLNAMYEAERLFFTKGDDWIAYYDSLGEICDEADCDSRSATAEQRARAFCAVLDQATSEA